MKRTMVMTVATLLMAGGAVSAVGADDQKQKGAETAQGSQKSQPQAQQQPQGQARAQPQRDQVSVFEKAQGALANIGEATAAIRRDEDDKAQQILSKTAESLRALRQTPASAVLSAIDRALPGEGAQSPGAQGSKGAGDQKGSGAAAMPAKMEMAPLMAEITSFEAYLDPKLVANVREAEKQAKGGDDEKAARTLRLARDTLMADLAFLPLDDAYSRVVAAETDLRAGRDADALRLLQNVPIVLERVQVSAPLVPVRFNLRAAAAAAEAGDWDTTKQLVSQATDQLETIVSAAPEGVSSDLRPIEKKISALDERLSKGGKPKPKELRDLAQMTRQAVKTM
jgi:hypothetical protein